MMTYISPCMVQPRDKQVGEYFVGALRDIDPDDYGVGVDNFRAYAFRVGDDGRPEATLAPASVYRAIRWLIESVAHARGINVRAAGEEILQRLGFSGAIQDDADLGWRMARAASALVYGESE